MDVLISVLLGFQVLMAVLAVLIVVFVGSLVVYMAIYKVPWVPTNGKQVEKMLALANIQDGERVFDLGCGDGSLLRGIACQRKVKAHGLDVNPVLLFVGQIRNRLAGVHQDISLQKQDFFKGEWPDADVVTVYLFPEINEKLEPLIQARYPAGTRVVARAFPFPNLVKKDEIQFEKERFFLYEL